jgi:hypothetical protein
MASYKNLTASALVKTGAGKVRGIVVASSSAGTIKLWDNTSAATTVLVNTTAAFTAPAVFMFPDDGIDFTVGLYITIGGTIDCTVIYD